MKNKIIIVLCVFLIVDVAYSGGQYCPTQNKKNGYIHNGPLIPKCTENDSSEIWSGSKADLDQIAKNADRMYGFENLKNLGRNATMLVPATRREMEWQIEQGEPWEDMFKIFSVYHQESRKDPRKWNNTKYVNKKTGAEVVYDDSTGKIVMDEKMGTRNFGKLGLWSTMFGEHNKLDMTPHDEKLGFHDNLSQNGDQYKYVGILFEHDPLNPDVYYIIDGQTGRRMTKREVLELPTTISNMWKDMGLACVKNDAIDIVPPKENRQSAQNASSEDDNGAGKDETLPVIDTTKLEGLLQNRISFLSRLVAVGRKITEEENRKENSLLDSVMTELASLVEIISLANVSDDKKIKMLDDIANRCMPYVEKINGLLREAEARGIASIKTGNLSAKLQENVRKIRNSTGKISND